MNQNKLLKRATQKLADVGIASPTRDARKLLRHAFLVEGLSDSLDGDVPTKIAAHFEAMVLARSERKPVSQILGYREFWGNKFTISEDTLDPRPDSELIVELALELGPFNRILDLGTGSGCLLLSILREMPNATGVGVDVSNAALDIAEKNAAQMELNTASEFLKSDWFEAVKGRYDLIVSNPPYISEDEMELLEPEVANWEPRIALTPGGDGLASYRVLAKGLRTHLEPPGAAILEIGSTQGDVVSEIFAEEGFARINVARDLNDKDRAILISN